MPRNARAAVDLTENMTAGIPWKEGRKGGV